MKLKECLETVNTKQNYKEREEELKEELKVEYENFLKTKEGQEWKDDWNKRYKIDANFGEYLYDFYTEMLI